MLKVKPAEGYPPEQGRYVRGNDFSPVAFLDYALYDIGAYPETAIYHKIVASLTQAPPWMEPGKSKMGMGFTLQKLLPGTNCKKCGRPTCLAFAIELAKGKRSMEDCPSLSEVESEAERQAIMKLLQ